MEKFLALPQERQDSIIAAAMGVFGTVGYKKAYISEIASTAGISKALIFHYFGNKKTMYLYMIEYAYAVLTAEMQDRGEYVSTDFFDRITSATKQKLAVMKRFPAINSFLGSVYFETNDEVAFDIQSILSKGEILRSQLVLDGIDTGKFKETVDPNLVLNILVRLAEGYANNLVNQSNKDIDKMIKEFEASVAMMKNNFYREEYLV